MELFEIVELIGIVVAIIVGISSIIFSLIAHFKSKEANKIAKEALELSKKINQQNLENILLENIKNPVLLKRHINIDYKNMENSDYSDYYLILQIRINNKSFQAATINEISAFIGKEGNANYFNMDDLVDVLSYDDFSKKVYLKNINEFPYYVLPKESKNITIVIGIEETDRIQFLANSCQLELKTSQKIYKLSVDGSMAIEK